MPQVVSSRAITPPAAISRQALPVDSPQRGAAEWATPALWVRGLRLPLFNRHEPFGEIQAAHTPVLAEGIVVRKVGEFVGRRHELRCSRRALRGPKAGLVIHGIGGVGKSTLSAELISQQAQQRLLVSLRGALSVDQILDELGARLTILLTGGGEDAAGQLRAWAQQLRAGDIEWSERWRALAEVILPALPILVLLDNFEDNLHRNGSAWRVHDPELAELLARWARRPGQSKLLITSRYPFDLRNNAHRRLEHLHLGPLSPAETTKLIWQLPGIDALPAADRWRAYRNVGGHPRTLEYLDALLRGGQARFDDVAERMEQALGQRGIEDPARWLATTARDADTALAEAVTLAVDDVVLGDLLAAIASTPLARELVIGASVHRVPIDETGLIWQIVEETKPAPDPDREARIARVHAAIQTAQETSASARRRPTAAELGLTDNDLAAYRAYLEALQRPPVSAPENFPAALAAACSAGLIAPVTRPGGSTRHIVHRWTARGLAQLEPERVTSAHGRAARYWRWRVAHVSQSEAEAIEQLIEARYHHHAAGQHDDALKLSGQIILQLRTWGQYGRAIQLCRETLGWLAVAGATRDAAQYIYQLGILFLDRGDYESAEQRLIEALEISGQLNYQAGLAASYQALGILARRRGDYDTAEQRVTQALKIGKQLGDQRGVASAYGELGIVAQLRGDYDTAEQRFTQALEIMKRLGDQHGVAASHTNLGKVAELRGDYKTAKERHTEALKISERLSWQAGLAISYQNLGSLAQARGDYTTAEHRFTQALEIHEQLSDQAGLALAYNGLGEVAQHRGDYDTAEHRFTQALEIHERLSDQAGLALSCDQLGTLAQARGDYTTAEQRYNQALEISERLGDAAGLAATHAKLATMMAERGNERVLIQPSDSEGIEAALRHRDNRGDGTAAHNLGVLLTKRGDRSGNTVRLQGFIVVGGHKEHYRAQYGGGYSPPHAPRTGCAHPTPQAR